MSEDVPAALKKPGAGLVELERELEALLVEYEPLSQAWPKEPHAVARAKIGRQVEVCHDATCSTDSISADGRGVT